MSTPPDSPGLFLPQFREHGSILVPATPTFGEYELSRSGLAVRAPLVETRVAAYPTSADLGLPIHSYEEVIAMVRALPFEMSMRAAAILQACLGHQNVRFDAGIQLKLAERLMPGSWILGQLRSWAAEPDQVIFSEQALFALQRLLVLYAPSEPDRLFDEHLHELFMQVLLATPTAVLDRARQPVSPEDWTAYVLRSGHYYNHERFNYLLARYHHFWHDLAPEMESEAHRDACPLHAWYHEVYGRSILEDEALALAVMAGTTHFLWDQPASFVADGELPENPLVVGRDKLLAASAIDARASELFKGIAATQEELRTEFAASEHDPDAAAWDTLPFARRPLVAIAEGHYVPVSPRLIEAWATSGVYHRLAEAAKRVGGETAFARFTRFFGEIVERYARELLSSALECGPLLAPRVIPPQSYRGIQNTQEETSDAVVDCAPDLILTEVVSGRLTQAVLVRAETSAAERDLERLVVGKARQIVRVARDLRHGRARVGPLAGPPPARLFPVIVSPEGVTQAPPLRAELGSQLGDSWRDQGLEALLILSLEELESLTALLRGGIGIVEILEAATSPGWREHGFSAWLADDGSPEPTVNPDFVTWSARATEAVHELLFPATY